MDALESYLGIHDGDIDVDRKRVCIGEAMPYIRDERVRQLASCLYNQSCVVSPDDVYNMICNKEWTGIHSILTKVPPPPPPPEEQYGDHRVLYTSLHDLCPLMVQNVWCDGDVPRRWFRGIYSFDNSRCARIASCVGTHIFCRQQLALAGISCALQRYQTHGLHVKYACDDWHVSSGTWMRLRNASATSVGHVVTLIVVSRTHRSAFTCVVASHEWICDRDDSMVLHHRGSPSVVLRFVQQAFGGVVVVELEDSDEWWPQFLLENRLVPPSLLPSLISSSPCSVSLADAVTIYQRKRKGIEVDELTDDRHVRSVLRTWNKSYESKYADAPILQSIARVSFAETLTHRGFSAHRVHVSTSTHGISARNVLVQRFGDNYGNCAMERTLMDGMAGLYAVYNSENVCVSAFAVLVYHTNDHRVACCIDSFAVATTHQGSGVGNVTFHAMLRGVCDHISPRGVPYVVFAQCVRSGDARHFWYDKLDESTMARSLLLQAFQIDPCRVPVQPTGQCTPRAREYTSSDLE